MTTPRAAGVHHVKLPVSDLARSAAWYEQLLGLERHLEFPDSDGIVRGVAYHPLPDGVALCLREAPDQAAALRGYDVIALLVPTRADLDDMTAHLDAHEVEHGPVVRATLGWLLACTDPDGLQLRFYTAEQHEPDPPG